MVKKSDYRMPRITCPERLKHSSSLRDIQQSKSRLRTRKYRNSATNISPDSVNPFQDPDRAQSAASSAAGALHVVPEAEDVLSAEYIISEYRPDLVRRVMKALSPDNVRVTVLSKKCRFFADKVSSNMGYFSNFVDIFSERLAS